MLLLNKIIFGCDKTYLLLPLLGAICSACAFKCNVKCVIKSVMLVYGIVKLSTT